MPKIDLNDEQFQSSKRSGTGPKKTYISFSEEDAGFEYVNKLKSMGRNVSAIVEVLLEQVLEEYKAGKKQ